MRLPLFIATTSLTTILASAALAQTPAQQPHNVVLFVADGLPARARRSRSPQPAR